MFSKLLHCDCAGRWGDAGTLVLRVALGLVFLMHGYQKVTSFGIPGVTNMLEGIGFPLPTMFAYILAYGELATGILMILGLLTHWAAKFQIIVAIIALFTVHLANGYFVNEGGFEFILLIGAAAIAILTTGGGKYSLDTMLFKKQPAPVM